MSNDTSLFCIDVFTYALHNPVSGVSNIFKYKGSQENIFHDKFTQTKGENNNHITVDGIFACQRFMWGKIEKNYFLLSKQ